MIAWGILSAVITAIVYYFFLKDDPENLILPVIGIFSLIFILGALFANPDVYFRM